MSFHVHECAHCGRLTEGAAYYASNAPRDPWGRIESKYRESNPPRFCSAGCRQAAEDEEA